MLKRIPKSDISIRPFKAYKSWEFDQDSSEVSILTADATSSALSNGFPKNSIYGQINSAFYNGNEDNPFTRLGTKHPEYNNSFTTKDRFLSGSAKIISIPNVYVGEGIKKSSVFFVNGTKTYKDDSYGNIISADGNTVILNLTDVNSSFMEFTDLDSNVYDTTIVGINGFDLQNNILNLDYPQNTSNVFDMNLISMDVETGTTVITSIPFLAGGAGITKVGNVFYNQGLVVFTRNIENILTSTWKLNYKSTQTIYENEYLLIVNQDEFNVSTNPSAVTTIGRETETITDNFGNNLRVVTNPGISYINKKTTLSNGNIVDYRYTSSYNGTTMAGFEHYDLSGSIDTTGSFLTTVITTIGLYDDELNLVAVAKLPKPIKSEHDIPVNFIVRFDT